MGPDLPLSSPIPDVELDTVYWDREGGGKDYDSTIPIRGVPTVLVRRFVLRHKVRVSKLGPYIDQESFPVRKTIQTESLQPVRTSIFSF